MDYIGRVEFQPQPFAVKGDSKWNSFADFVTDCKAAPGTLKVANSGTGSSTHAAAIMLMNAAGCEVIHLPKGIKGRNKSVLNGEADAMIAPLTGAVCGAWAYEFVRCDDQSANAAGGPARCC